MSEPRNPDRQKDTPDLCVPEAVNGSTRSVLIRFTIYTLLILAFTRSLTILSRHEDWRIFKENGFVEWFQFGLLVAASAVFIVGSLRLSAFRELLLLLACVSTFAAIRELDNVLNRLLPWIGWKIGFALLLYAVGSAIANRHKLKLQIAHFVSSPAFAVLWAGFILAVPVAQMLGHGPLLKALMGDDYNNYYKRLIEESAETVGYVLIVAGSIESWVYLKKRCAQTCLQTLPRTQSPCGQESLDQTDV